MDLRGSGGRSVADYGNRKILAHSQSSIKRCRSGDYGGSRIVDSGDRPVFPWSPKTPIEDGKMTEQQALVQKRRERADLSDYLLQPFNRLRAEVDHFFDDFPARFPASAVNFRQLAAMPMPAMEMTETDDQYHLTVEVPGVAAEDVDISLEGDLLVLKGEKREEEEKKGRNYCVSERSYGSFERRVTLPPDAIADDISASSDNGVLTIVIPRDAEPTPDRRRIDVQTKAPA